MDLKTCQQLITQAFDPLVEPARFQIARKLVNPSASLDPADRLLIYRHSITGGQQRVLEMIYPVCMQILGDACFDTLARDYAWGPQSNCNDLNQYGEYFANTLEEQIQHHPALNELPYLPDLARLEWAWHQSLFKTDDPVFDPVLLQDLVAQFGEQLCPKLSHSLFMLSSPWPVYAIWQSYKQGEEVKQFNMPDDTQYLIISRHDDVLIEKVPVAIYHFLQQSQKGLALSAIADRLGDPADVAFQQLPVMIEKGWICGFHPLCLEA